MSKLQTRSLTKEEQWRQDNRSRIIQPKNRLITADGGPSRTPDNSGKYIYSWYHGPPIEDQYEDENLGEIFKSFDVPDPNPLVNSYGCKVQDIFGAEAMPYITGWNQPTWAAWDAKSRTKIESNEIGVLAIRPRKWVIVCFLKWHEGEPIVVMDDDNVSPKAEIRFSAWFEIVDTKRKLIV